VLKPAVNDPVSRVVNRPVNVAHKSSASRAQNQASRVPLFSETFSFGLLGLMALNSAVLTHGGEVEYAGSDLSAALFLAVGFVYRGSMLRWWVLFLPSAFVLLFMPIGFWQSHHLLGFGGLLRASVAPVLSLIASSLLASFRDTRQEVGMARHEIDGVVEKNKVLIERVKKMEADMRSVLQATSSVKPLAELVTGGWHTKEIRFGAAPASQLTRESAVLGYREVESILNAAIDSVRQTITNRGVTSLRMTLTTPAESSLPMAVRGNAEDLKLLLEAVFEQAAMSVGTGPDGIVRASLRPGLGALSLLIEDNGRGFSDAVLERTSPGLLDRWERIRKASQECGWAFSRQARLGVGSRVSIELQRVDAFAQGGRSSMSSRSSSQSSSQSAGR
jgi:hypothetical protein